MSRKVLFNGAVLYRPGAATKIDASAFNSLNLVGLGTVGLVGEADDGQPSVAKVFADAEGLKQYYRSGPLVEMANIVANPSKDPRIPSGATAIVAVKVNQSTQSQYQSVASAVNQILFKSRKYGDFANLLTVALAAGPTTGRVLTVRDKSAATLLTETSPELGATGKFTIQYTGAAAASAMTITATSLSIANTGAVDNITINFASIKNLADVIARLTATGKYTTVSLIANAQAFNPANLDFVSAVDIKTAPVTVFSRNFDIADWANNFSSLITATRSSAGGEGATWPDVFTEILLAGAVRGTSSNSTWVSAFAILGTVDVQQVVPGASRDGSVFGLGDTYTFASVAASAEAHCRLYSSTIGKSERQAWVGGALSKTNLIAQANALNSEHACLSGQQPFVQFVDGSLGYGEEYLLAALFAGMRAGAPIAEPLTWKFPNCVSVQVRDASWDPESNTDSADLINNGIMYVRNVTSKGARIERGLTTFIKFENDAYTEESVVQTWKLCSRRLRARMEDTYTGTRGLLANVRTVLPTMKTEADRLKEDGAITDSIVNGQTIDGYRNAKLTLTNDVLSYSAIISPVEGINFELQTIYVVPAQIQL